MMESVDAQIFLAYIAYKRCIAKYPATYASNAGFAEFRKTMLMHLQLIDVWLSEGLKNVPT